MAATHRTPKRNSGSSEASPVLPFAGLEPQDWLPAAQPRMSEAAARASLTGFDIMEAWLAASRRMIDLWRESVREQQDCMLASWREQVVRTTETTAAATRSPRRRRRSSRRAAAEATNGTHATRH